MLPNSESESVEPNQDKKMKIYQSKFEYFLLDKHVEYSDQHMGAVHPSQYNKDVKLMKDCCKGKGKICTQTEGHRELHPGPILNSSIYKIFIKIKFLI